MQLELLILNEKLLFFLKRPAPSSGKYFVEESISESEVKRMSFVE